MCNLSTNMCEIFVFCNFLYLGTIEAILELELQRVLITDGFENIRCATELIRFLESVMVTE
jgi:hypothetical protein